MAAATGPEAVFSCANAQNAQRGASKANRDRNFIFRTENSILTQRGDVTLNGNDKVSDFAAGGAVPRAGVWAEAIRVLAGNRLRFQDPHGAPGARLRARR